MVLYQEQTRMALRQQVAVHAYRIKLGKFTLWAGQSEDCSRSTNAKHKTRRMWVAIITGANADASNGAPDGIIKPGTKNPAQA